MGLSFGNSPSRTESRPSLRHPGESGIHVAFVLCENSQWIPAFAGMTKLVARTVQNISLDPE